MDGINLFMQLSLLMVLATIVALVAKKFRQPLILSYIVSGLLAGSLLPLTLNLLDKPAIDPGMFDIFSSLGIAFLLFIIGTELSMAVFRKLGSVVFAAALAILASVGVIGLVAGIAAGFALSEAIIIGLALFFSSTIIIVKVLSDRKQNNRLHGQIAIGVVLVDDIVATIALLYVAAGREGFSLPTLGLLAIKGLILAAVLVFSATKILPRVTRSFASSQELLFLFTISWGLGVASLFQYVGFSIEIGALFAGVSLASLPYAQEMASRLKSLRDFFIVIFFITLGAGMNLGHLSENLWLAIGLSAAVLILKPIVVIGVLNLFKYTKRTAFKTGINLSQISEFSIILVAVASAYGVASKGLVAMITLVALITITISTYLIQYDERLFAWLAKRFKFFQDTISDHDKIGDAYSAFLFGYRRGGVDFVKTFQADQQKFLIVDYDPLVIESLETQQLPFVYGDAKDTELLREIGIKQVELVVSTITSFATTRQLLIYAKRMNPEVIFIAQADDYDESAELYRLGADYVMLPHYVGSEHLNGHLREHGINKLSLKRYRQANLFGLGEIALKRPID